MKLLKNMIDKFVKSIICRKENFMQLVYKIHSENKIPKIEETFFSKKIKDCI